MKSRLFPLAVALAVALADRVTKLWIVASVSAWDIHPVIPGFFNIIHSENEGMAFSILADADPRWRSLVLIGVSLCVLGLIAWLFWQATSPRSAQGRTHSPYALALLLGGALGNLYDRLVRGSVTDFLDVYLGSYHWPTFNVADSAITVGALLLALEMLRRPRTAEV